ncbi:MAG: hypothetical protein JWO12_3143 [Frankiales bacterium]|nr:hypothetical protein [Frankiales bacterium]
MLLTTACSPSTPEAVPSCTAGGAVVTPEQGLNAATIAAVGKRLGLPSHAVTVALATAFQESKLRNLDYGDRDSLGLFQQRPSQGWGPPAVIRTPRLSAASFYRHLTRIPGWQALPVTVAAQKVQHSGAPAAYAQWEEPSRELASALTGEVAAGFTCQFRPSPRPGKGTELQAAAVLELGPGGLLRAATPASRWTTASWLVAHASAYGVSTVSTGGRTWQAKRGTWKPDPKATTLTWS